jgi:hypothetical protein
VVPDMHHCQSHRNGGDYVTDRTELELLAVTLVDIRASIDAMKRSVTNAQSSVEQFRHTQNQEQIEDIADCFVNLTREAAEVTEAITSAGPQIDALRTPR